ncbi:MAG: hypothetical protein QOC79_2630 [Actinomycetota bacterium]|nr:hypothetical protein [Actinomycetota bacterium]
MTAAAVIMCAVFAACSSSSGGSDAGLGATTTARKAAGTCTGKTLQSTEVGVTPTTITVTVMADIGSPLAPGLFQDSIDGVKAWAAYVNANGGLGCRQIAVDVVDSKLSADEAKNGLVATCGKSLILVGTSSLFLNDMRPAEGCKDKAGVATGIPDVAAVQTEPAEQCSKVAFAIIQQGSSCPYSGSGVRDFKESTGEVAWFKKNVTSDLHGVFVVAADLPSAISASTPAFAGIEQNGVKRDSEFGMSGLATQSQYAPIAQAIKDAKSTWVINGLDLAGIVKMRKEAVAQGVSTVKVWACLLSCYAPRFITQGGSAVEGQYAWLQFLPFEAKGNNDMLDTFLQYDKNPDAFGVQAFSAGLLLQQIVEGIVTRDGPNAITRSAILAGLRTVHDFDAGGMLPKTDVAGRTTSPCIVIVQVQHGAWTQVDPSKKGAFDCTEPGALTSLSLDPIKAYKPG